MEEKGFWRPLSEVPKYELYRKEADWIEPMWDIIPSKLLKEHGVFNATTNPKGCVRDHIFGRSEGFKLGVPPILLRHPTNCQILTHSFNVVKGQTNDIGKTLVELINDIQNYTNEWKEQKKCLIEIQKFLNGEKYSPEGG